jgi:hypothetical protein
MKRIISSLLVLMFIIGLFLFSNSYADDYKGKTYYTKVNIWYDNPEKVSIDNPHRGAILPAGTRVIFNKVNREINFTIDSGLTFSLIIRKKGPRKPGRRTYTMSSLDYFNRMFSEKNVTDKDGDFNKFTLEEQRNIKEGTISKGMRREAVLMAYGYPPISSTPSLLSEAWNYIGRGNRDRILIIFKDSKVVSIEESEISGGPPGTRSEKLIKTEDKGN